MATVRQHYSDLLAELYSWTVGGFDAALERGRELVRRYDLRPRGSGIAIDAGAGCGFHAIPLAEEGFEVYAIDTDAALLRELESHAGELPIVAIHDDLRRLRAHTPGGAELVVCLTDTVLLLDSKEEVLAFVRDAHDVLEAGGRLVLTFRDLSTELVGLDRFIPVRSDADRLFTCFLEYEPETVNVHDLVYVRRDGRWELRKSHYRKLRLSREWVAGALSSAGFGRVAQDVDNGVATVVGVRAG